MGQKTKRFRSKAYLSKVREHGCLICERWAQAHHLMFAEPSAMGLKSGDDWAVPLCAEHHLELHVFGDEKTWWDMKGINPLDWCESMRKHRTDGSSGS
jgi:hypothetical protein